MHAPLPGALRYLTFPDSREEVKYLGHVGRTNRNLAATLRILSAVCFSVGLYKVTSNFCSHSQTWSVTVRYIFLLVSQVAVIVTQTWSAKLMLSSPWSLAKHEAVKINALLVSVTCVMVSVIMKDSGDLEYISPVSAMLIHGHSIVFDQMRLYTALKLHAVSAICFLYMEASDLLQTPSGLKLQKGTVDLALYLVFGVLLPIIESTVLETYMRYHVLIRLHQRPMSALGPFWETCARFVCNRIPRIRPASILGWLRAPGQSEAVALDGGRSAGGPRNLPEVGGRASRAN
jgi:hypothetical protein